MSKCIYVWIGEGKGHDLLFKSLAERLGGAGFKVISSEELVRMYYVNPRDMVRENDPVSHYIPHSAEELKAFFNHLKDVTEEKILKPMGEGKNVVFVLDYWLFWPMWAFSSRFGKDIYRIVSELPQEVNEFEPNLSILIEHFPGHGVMNRRDKKLFDILFDLHRSKVRERAANYHIVSEPSFAESTEETIKKISDLVLAP